jgi:hypothetical protein
VRAGRGAHAPPAAAKPLVRCHMPSRGPCSAARLGGVSGEAEGAGTPGEAWRHGVGRVHDGEKDGKKGKNKKVGPTRWLLV